MRIKSLELKNFRCFSDFRVDFCLDEGQVGGLTVFVAKNGEGKTAVLDAINIAWGTFVGAMPNSRGAGFKSGDARAVFVDGQLVETGRPELTATFADLESGFLQGLDGTVQRTLTSSEKKKTTTVKDARVLSNYAKFLLAKQEERLWPILAYYGDSRLWANIKQTRAHAKAYLSTSRKYGYADATNPSSGYKEFSLWFQSLCFWIYTERFRRDQSDPSFDADELERYETFHKVVQKALDVALEPAGWGGVDLDSKGVFARNLETREKIQVDRLSAGVRIVLGTVADIAYRCCKLNPMLGREAALKTPGIVLIDEIELHLHPVWQQKILPILRKVFPSIQFIVTTHSPQVVSSVPKESIRTLKNGKAEQIDTETQGVEAQNILCDVFGTNPAPENDEYVQKLDQYAKMQSHGLADSIEGSRLYEELNAHYGETYPPLNRIVALKRLANRLKQ
ncbi:MAG: AAA family ATPase [Thermoguttaceae bacterium]|nr:AAA family ATPase [Thermoguttaceae bacterium]